MLNPLYVARTRHIDQRYKWIISQVADFETFKLRQVLTNEMPADGLTKPLQRLKHEEFKRLIRVVKVPREGVD
ncbi:hypothetical protein IMZ48_33150 [Candidatus Bathyarchaeota archaeon]|nr:hypothetical protein [Candidatus Bathyarchaeota archaeon]